MLVLCAPTHFSFICTLSLRMATEPGLFTALRQAFSDRAAWFCLPFFCFFFSAASFRLQSAATLPIAQEQ